MKTKLFFLTLTLLFFIVACQSDKEKDDQGVENQTYKKFENEDKITKQMADIDSKSDLTQIHSLNYNNNAGSTVEATGYLDKAKKEVKIEYLFSDVATGNYGKNVFYIDNGKKFATQEVYFDNQIQKPSFVERISFYDKNEKVIFTKERVAEYEEELEDMPFQIAKLKDCSIKIAMDALNQTGQFVTTFQGVVTNGNLKYIIVGENTADGYASSIAIQFEDTSIKKLIDNEENMIGTPLEVEFAEMVDESGLSFQVLLALTIK